MPLWLTITIAVAGLIAHALGLFSALVSALKAWFRHELNGATERLDRDIKDIEESLHKLERSDSALDQATGDLAKKSLQAEFQIAQLQQNTGELKGMFGQLLKSIETGREAQHEHEKALTRQLAQLEAHLDVADALRGGVERLAAVLQHERERQPPGRGQHRGG
jgi:chromosome segregation ATPase